MLQYILKTILAACLIVAVSELAKRSAILGSILASIPLISFFAILFLYADTHSIEAVSKLSIGIFWLVLPSLLFLVTLPALLKLKINFPLSIAIALGIMIAGYFVMILILRQFGFRL